MLSQGLVRLPILNEQASSWTDKLRAFDLEEGPWPYAGRRFDAIVVTNYLFRPRLPLLLTALNHGGVLIYETFMVGNERFGKPSNEAFLLRFPTNSSSASRTPVPWNLPTSRVKLPSPSRRSFNASAR
jgi:hypothetical protein